MTPTDQTDPGENPYRAPRERGIRLEPRPWGLFAKTNPRATRASVIRHALVSGAIMAAAYPFGCLWRPFLAQYSAVLFPLAVACAAGLGAILEWQVDNSEDDP